MEPATGRDIWNDATTGQPKKQNVPIPRGKSLRRALNLEDQVARQETSVILKIYLLDESRPSFEEGHVVVWKDQGKILNVAQQHFDSLDDLPAKIRAALDEAGIGWPRNSQD